MPLQLTIENLKKLGLEEGQAKKCLVELQQEVNMGAMERQLTDELDLQDDPRSQHEKKMTHDEQAEFFMKVALRAKNNPTDPLLQRQLERMPAVGKAVAFIQQFQQKLNQFEQQTSTNASSTSGPAQRMLDKLLHPTFTPRDGA